MLHFSPFSLHSAIASLMRGYISGSPSPEKCTLGLNKNFEQSDISFSINENSII
jgi:hypothetical protein